MHPRSKDWPTQSQLVFPLLDTVREMGGRAKPADVVEALADRLGLTAEQRNRCATSAEGEAVRVFRRHIHYARLRTVHMNYLQRGDRGNWILVDEGPEALDHAQRGVIVTLSPHADGKFGCAQIELAVQLPKLSTIHTLVRGDARNVSFLPDGSIQLIVTSMVYHDLVQYESVPGQLGDIADYEEFKRAMEAVFAEMYRVLQPGCRACVNVGDVLRSRKEHGRHHVLPLHAHMLTAGERVGFDVMTGIFWKKIGNCSYEQGPGGVLGKPGQPNQAIKLEHESILMLRRPGPYRATTEAQRQASAITPERSRVIFRDIWDDIPGVRHPWHPAAFDEEVAGRCIEGWSFVGDTVADFFGGSLATVKAGMRRGRNTVAVDVAPGYLSRGLEDVTAYARQLTAA